MSVVAWIVLGLIAGFIASKIVNKSGEGLITDILLGVVGAVVGGHLFNQFGQPGASGLNLYSILVAIVGAIIVLVIYHLIAGRRRVLCRVNGRRTLGRPSTELPILLLASR